ncbi:MAG: HEAT repeat domain-containing protein [Cytophagales bacterium]
MAFNLGTTLEIEERETNKVILFTLQSFFIGVFISTFEIGSTSLFLEYFNQSDLPKAFIISGLAGVVFTTIFTSLQRSIKFKNLSLINLFVISVLTILLRYSFNFTDDPMLIYLVFIFMGPLKVIAFLGFWGMASRVFSLRQGKRLFGLIDSGQVFGAILIGFSTVLIMQFLPDTKDLLVISSGSILVTLILQFLVNKRYGGEIVESLDADDKIEDNEQSYKFLKSSYIQFMVFFVVLSTITVFFIYNSFLTVTKDQFPESRDLTNFLGFFISMVMIFSFLFKTFLYSRLIQMYGLKVVLIILPILLFIITISASIVGTVFGFTQATSVNFTLFFILIALSQLFSLSLKNSLEVPAFKILYQPLPKKIRYDVQARIDGIVNESSAVLAGLILLGLSLLEFIELIHFSYSLIVIISIWIYITVKLYNYYKSTLQDSLSRGSKSSGSVKGEARIRSLIKDELKTESSDKLIRSLQLTANYEPNLFEIFISDLIKSENNELQSYALQKVGDYNLLSLRSGIKELIKSTNNNTLKKQAEDVLISLEETDKRVSQAEMLYSLVNSREFEDRVFSAKILGEIKFDDHLNLMTELIKDHHPKVKKAAIAAIAKLNLPELWPKLVENLNNNNCVQAATSAIISIGDRILPTLEQSFYKSGYSAETMLQIIRIYGIIGGKNAEEYLLKKINYPDGRIVKHSLLALKSCNYKAATDKRGSIHQTIETTISNILWNLVALENLKDDEITENLVEALEQEVKENYEFLFLLLSLAYDPQSIKYVQENIETGTTEGIGYAIELLDIFIAEEIKPKLFPILEDNSLADKIRQLEPYFPVAEYSKEGLIRQIINRNYNYTNRWTKACALLAVLKLEEPKVSDDLIAILFNQDVLLRQSAAWVIYNISEEVYHECTNRIPEKEKRILDEAIALKIQYGYPLLYDLTLALSKSKGFARVNKSVICKMADQLKMSKSLKNNTVLDSQDSEHFNLYYLWEGSISEKHNEKVEVYVEKGQVFGPVIWNVGAQETVKLIAESDCIYFILKEDFLFDLMNQHNSLAHAIYTLAKEGHAIQFA